MDCIYQLYTGLVTAVTIGFFLGRYVGMVLFPKLQRFKRVSRAIGITHDLIGKYGNTALFLGYFIPIVRYLMPLIAGSSRMNYGKFAMISYSGALVWSLLFFKIGIGGMGFIESLRLYAIED